MLGINKNYAIGSDELNIILYKQGGEPVKKYRRALGYYSTCESALKALVDMEIKVTRLKDFDKVVSKVHELRQSINGLNLRK